MPVTLPNTIVAGTPIEALKVQDNFDALATAINAIAASPDLPGIIKAYGGAAAPAGYLLCDGAAVSRTTYSDLFNVLGTTYGAGNGTTTFNLPDLRGRMPVGVDGAAARLTANDALGQASGAEKHTLAETELPNHVVQNTGVQLPQIRTGALNAGTDKFLSIDGVDDTHTNTAYNQMPPYQIVNYIIKT